MQEQPSLDGVTIVFDLDGTLVDTALDLVAALNVALTDAGYESVDAIAVQGQIGLGSKEMIRVGLATQGMTPSEPEIDAMRAVLLAHYAENTANHSTIYPGVIAALDRLEAAGAVLAICTNKPQGLADTLLRELGLHQRFEAIVGSDSVPAHKPDPAHLLRTIELANGTPNRAVMIGDSNPDERAAQRAGLPFIFIPFGYGPIDKIQQSRTQLANYAELSPKFIADLI